MLDVILSLYVVCLYIPFHFTLHLVVSQFEIVVTLVYLVIVIVLTGHYSLFVLTFKAITISKAFMILEANT